MGRSLYLVHVSGSFLKLLQRPLRVQNLEFFYGISKDWGIKTPMTLGAIERAQLGGCNVDIIAEHITCNKNRGNVE